MTHYRNYKATKEIKVFFMKKRIIKELSFIIILLTVRMKFDYDISF